LDIYCRSYTDVDFSFILPRNRLLIDQRLRSFLSPSTSKETQPA